MNYQFSPKLALSLFSAFLLLLLLALGYWQLQRAEEKRVLIERYTSHSTQTPVNLNKVSNLEDNEFRHVVITGTFDESHTLLLDNQIHTHQVGYEVLTPFREHSTGRWILVNRGWIPQGANRQQLPTIKKPQGGVLQITGTLKRPTSLLVLKHEIWEQHFPLRIQAIDLARVSHHLQRSFYEFMVLLAPNEANGFVRAWPSPAPRVSVKRHIAYATQWFSMALVLLVLYACASFKRISESP